MKDKMNEYLVKSYPDVLGVWCPHGHKIVWFPDNSPYKVGRLSNPWPCPNCTYDEFEAEMLRELHEGLS